MDGKWGRETDTAYKRMQEIEEQPERERARQNEAVEEQGAFEQFIG